MPGFSHLDYGILASSLLVSIAIGVFFALRQRLLGDDSGSEAMLGGGQMPLVPTSLSLLASFLSGILILGVPAEIYTHGGAMWLYMMSCNLSLLFVAIFIIPICFQLRTPSLYHYLEERFKSRLLLYLGAGLWMVYSIAYMAVVLYAPAVALSAVTGVPIWGLIISVGGVSTLYTSIGGLKAVVWTDTVQAGLMLAGVLILLFKVLADVWPLSQVVSDAVEGGHLGALWNLDPSPLQQFSTWIAVGGGTVFWLGQYGINQVAMQRYRSLGSLKKARKLVLLTAIGYSLLTTAACSIGFILVSYYKNCDPLASKRVAKPDQLVIQLVIDSIVSRRPGMKSRGLHVSGGKAIAILSLVMGVFVSAAAFLCGPLGGIVRSVTTVLGALSGPVCGLFLLGIFVPRAGARAATVSVGLTLVLMTWLSIGGTIHSPYAGYRLPISGKGVNERCPENYTVTVNQTFVSRYGNLQGLPPAASPGVSSKIEVWWPYRIANWLYPGLGLFLVLVSGLLLSFCLPERRKTRDTVELVEFESLSQKL